MLTHNTDKPDIYLRSATILSPMKNPKRMVGVFFSLLFVCGVFFFFSVMLHIQLTQDKLEFSEIF